MPTFHLTTFGCKTNQYESQGVRESLVAAGFAEVNSPTACDVCVVNTCSVTQRADAEARKIVRAIHRDNPAARIVLTGCMADLERNDITSLEGVALVVPNAEKHTIASRLAASNANAGEPDRFAFSIQDFAGHTRAFIKIQDGCANFCSYCTVPRARGKPSSRPAAAILQEARALVQSGHRELVLTGINIGGYRDADGLTLGGLMRQLGETPGLLRLRCGSVEPPSVTDELLLAIRATPVICQHLHIPLQSGDDGVLRAMNRRYTRDDFTRVVERARDVLDDPGITSDTIVGFPGEDDAAFESTRSLVKALQFSRTHVFLFSPRPGTPAAELRQTTPNRDITSRRDRLLETAETAASAYANRSIGRQENVLVESAEDGVLTGYTDRYLRIRCDGPEACQGQLVQVQITGNDGVELTGIAQDPDKVT